MWVATSFAAYNLVYRVGRSSIPLESVFWLVETYAANGTLFSQPDNRFEANRRPGDTVVDNIAGCKGRCDPRVVDKLVVDLEIKKELDNGRQRTLCGV